jgi:hypothetical protein
VQHFEELVLRRGRLLSGEAGGLAAVRSDEKDFLFVQFSSHGFDPFDERFGAFRAPSLSALESCLMCHQGTGLPSVPTVTGHLSGAMTVGVNAGSYPAAVEQAQAALRSGHGYGLLQGLLAER